MVRRMKKVGVICLIVCLLMLQVDIALAYQHTGDIDRKTKHYLSAIDQLAKEGKSHLKEKVNADMKLLDDFGILDSCEDLTIDTESSEANKKIVYNLKCGRFIEHIQVVLNENDECVLLCTEGEKRDIINKNSNGELFINGEEVSFSSDTNDILEDAGDEPSRILETWFQTRCPYGSHSDYTVEKTTLRYNKAAVDFNSLVRLMTFAAFSAAMISSIAGWVGSSVAEHFADPDTFAALVDSGINTDAISYKVKVYTHSDYPNGFISPIITRVWRQTYTYYAQPNYVSKFDTSYEYKCQM